MAVAFQDIDIRKFDLRAVAEPLAVLSPLALIVSAQEIVMSGVALLFVWHSWRTRDFSWARQPWMAALLALWAFAFARTLLDHPTATGLLLALHWIHFAIYAAALAYWILPDERSRQRLLYATVATLGFYAFDCLFQFVFGVDIIGRRAWYYRLTSVFSKPGVGVEIAWLCLPALLGLWRDGKPAIAAAFGCACFAAVLLSGDRTGLLDLAAAGLLVGALYRPLRRPFLVFVPLIAVVAGGLLVFSPIMRERQIDSTISSVEHFSQSSYGIVFTSGLNVILEHPLIGVGLHNYQSVCQDERLGPLQVGPELEFRCQGHPHNTYLQWAAETGLIGLALYVAFIGFALAAVIRSAAWGAGDAVFFGLVASLALRFWPLSGGTSFFSSWSAEPLFLVLGWTLAWTARTSGRATDDEVFATDWTVSGRGSGQHKPFRSANAGMTARARGRSALLRFRGPG
jgi:O-antigen ligase